MIIFLLKLLVLSWRVRFAPAENGTARGEAAKTPAVIGLWHRDLPACLAAFKNKNIAVLISKSRDGSMFAKLAETLGYKVFRGSSSNGQEGVRHLLRALKNGHSAGMALDGPKGPAGVAKAGAGWLSKKAGVPLAYIHVEYGRHITLNSWDKTKIPLPFGKITISASVCDF